MPRVKEMYGGKEGGGAEAPPNSLVPYLIPPIESLLLVPALDREFGNFSWRKREREGGRKTFVEWT